jgi:hypothetical protein
MGEIRLEGFPTGDRLLFITTGNAGVEKSTGIKLLINPYSLHDSLPKSEEGKRGSIIPNHRTNHRKLFGAITPTNLLTALQPVDDAVFAWLYFESDGPAHGRD